MSFAKAITKAGQDTGRYLGGDRLQLAPFLNTLRNYNVGKCRADLRAAVAVTMLGVPQSLAYATIAGLPIFHGVICSAVAALTASLFSSSRFTVLGPTNATALMLFSFFALHPELADRSGELLPLLVIMAGVAAVAASLLRVADLLQFVSQSVLVGYVAGAAVLIIANQLKHMLGVAAWIDGESSSTFAGLLIELSRSMCFIQWQTVLVGALTIALFFGLKKWRPRWPGFSITLVLCSLIFGAVLKPLSPLFAGLETYQTFTFSDITPKMPELFRPEIFSDISSLFAVALGIAFLSCLENSMMARSLASRSGSRPDANQDMFSVGMANLASAVSGGMPASASLTRSALNADVGARTRFASFFSGLMGLGMMVLIAASVGWGVPLIDFVPKAGLAALVIAVSLSLFNIRHIRICLRSTADDAVVLIVTFLATLIAPLYVAIFIGVAVSVSLFLRRASRPHLVEYEFSDEGELREIGEKHKRPLPAISIVHVEGDLFFGAADLFRTQIQRVVADEAIKVIILRLKNARHLDATSVMALEDLVRFMRSDGRHLIVSGAPREVYKVLKRSGVLETIQEGCVRQEGETNLFIGNSQNPNLSTRNALLRAQELLGTKQADIRIYYDPAHEKKPAES